jgi:hypothetical protein
LLLGLLEVLLHLVLPLLLGLLEVLLHLVLPLLLVLLEVLKLLMFLTNQFFLKNLMYHLFLLYR